MPEELRGMQYLSVVGLDKRRELILNARRDLRLQKSDDENRLWGNLQRCFHRSVQSPLWSACSLLRRRDCDHGHRKHRRRNTVAEVWWRYDSHRGYQRQPCRRQHHASMKDQLTMATRDGATFLADVWFANERSSLPRRDAEQDVRNRCDAMIDRCRIELIHGLIVEHDQKRSSHSAEYSPSSRHDHRVDRVQWPPHSCRVEHNE